MPGHDSDPFELPARLNFLFALPAMEASRRQEWCRVVGAELLGFRKTYGKELRRLIFNHSFIQPVIRFRHFYPESWASPAHTMLGPFVIRRTPIILTSRARLS